MYLLLHGNLNDANSFLIVKFLCHARMYLRHSNYVYYVIYIKYAQSNDVHVEYTYFVTEHNIDLYEA